MKKAIVEKQKENEQLKRDWIRHQAELVNYINLNQELNKEIREQKTKATILAQKQLRLKSKFYNRNH